MGCCSSNTLVPKSVAMTRDVMEKAPSSPKNKVPPALINLRTSYDRDLLHRFYNELMVPSFGMFSDELESVDVWEENLRSNSSKYTLHVIMAMESIASNTILGGVAVEFYPESQCGLLTYIVTNPVVRGKGVSKQLVGEALRLMNAEATGGVCRAMFLETNNDPQLDTSDVMDHNTRQTIFRKLGFEFINFKYVQPPLSPEKQPVHSLMLCVHQSSPHADLAHHQLEARVVLDFITEFSKILQGDTYEEDANYQNMRRQLQGTYVQLRD